MTNQSITETDSPEWCAKNPERASILLGSLRDNLEIKQIKLAAMSSKQLNIKTNNSYNKGWQDACDWILRLTDITLEHGEIK